MPGTYAPPAVEEPKTTLMVGMPAFDRAVRSRKVRPPRTKMSFWVRRSAPADSVRLMTGRRFSRAICRPGGLGDRVRVHRPALDGGVGPADEALDAADHADARDGGAADVEVRAVADQRLELEERAACRGPGRAGSAIPFAERLGEGACRDAAFLRWRLDRNET
jgi:hypothetical protein